MYTPVVLTGAEPTRILLFRATCRDEIVLRVGVAWLGVSGARG